MSNFILSAKATMDATDLNSGLDQSTAKVGALDQAFDRVGGGIGPKPAQNVALARHEVSNLSFQVNDIAVMMASGQNPFLMMMQQGGQISQIMGNRGLGQIIPALGKSLLSLITPTTLFLAGITVLGVGAKAVFDAMGEDIIDVDDAMSAHEATISSLKDAYGDAILGLRDYGQESAAVHEALLKADATQLRLVLQQQSRSFIDDISSIGLDEAFLEQLEVDESFAPFQTAIFNLRNSIEDGRPEVAAFRNEIAEMANAPGASEELATLAGTLLETSDAALRAEQGLAATEDAIGSLGFAIFDVEGDLDSFNQAMAILDRLAEPRLSPLQQATAARDKALQNSGGGIERAAILEQFSSATAEIERREAEREAQRLARRRPRRDPAEVILERQAGDLERIRLETTLLAANDNQRQIGLATLEAEQEIRRRGIDARSEEAEKIRDNAKALTEEQAILERSQAAWDTLEGSASNAIDKIFDALLDRKADIGDVLQGIAADILKTAATLGALNPLKNSLFGSDLPTFADSGGGGFFASILGSLTGGGGGGVPFGPQPLAFGGMVVGPGGPTDDRVPILASNGEFVLNAAATARHRPLIEAINDNRLPQLAGGGPVVSFPSGGGGSAGGVGGARVTVNLIGAPPGTRVEQRQSDDGGVDLDIIMEQIDQRVGQNIAEGKYDSPFERYGALPRRRA